MAESLSPQEVAAMRAVEALAQAQEAVAVARFDRDAAIAVLFKSGQKPPEIARLTGMSVSNVRLITDRLRWANPNPS